MHVDCLIVIEISGNPSLNNMFLSYLIDLEYIAVLFSQENFALSNIELYSKNGSRLLGHTVVGMDRITNLPDIQVYEGISKSKFSNIGPPVHYWLIS